MPQDASRRPFRAWGLVAVGAAVLAYMGRFAASPAWSPDMAAELWPFWTFTRHWVARGELPLWNPYLFGGIPWYAEPQAGLFYPPNLLFYLFPFERVAALYLALHMGIAGLGMRRLLLHLGLEEGPAAVGAVAWILSGFYLKQLYFPPIAACTAWMPWLLYAALAGPGWRSTAGAAAALGLLVLAGAPQFVLYAAVALAVVSWRRPLATLLALVGGAGLSAVQWCGVLAFLPQTVRSVSSHDFAFTFSLLPNQMLWAVAPELYAGRPLDPRWDGLIYLGFMPLALAALAGRARDLKGGAGPWWLLAALGLLVALGKYTPFYPALVAVLPALNGFRAPVRALALTALSLSVLGAVGLRRLPSRLQPVAGVLLAVELLGLGWPLLESRPYVDPAVFQQLEQQPGFYRIHFVRPESFEMVNSGLMHDVGSIVSYDPLASAAYITYVLFNDLQAMPDAATLDRVRFNSNAVLVQRVDTNLVRLLGVRWLIDGDRLAPYAGLPRAFLAGRVRVVPDLAATLPLLQTIDPREEVVLDRPAPPVEPPVQHEVRLMAYTPNHADLAVTTDKPAMLLLSDVYAPGWKADLDGTEVPIYRADGIFRACHIPPGSHRLVMRYDPPDFKLGLAVSLATLAVLLILARKKGDISSGSG